MYMKEWGCHSKLDAQDPTSLFVIGGPDIAFLLYARGELLQGVVRFIRPELRVAVV